ncbi:M20/M25/M40 family metallo-hydrolase [Lactiplantibacillus plantarum]|uniref:M20/M25/M40 family metallo-hydrolase n=1 Tax=Lactiplantibacillus plantarum TaxID=1590 RepID=UPI004045F81E
MYAHGDVVRGYDEQWRDGLAPWRLTAEGDRWYGRGTADNKGQHTINLAALREVLRARDGRLGFNATWLIETGEEAHAARSWSETAASPSVAYQSAACLRCSTVTPRSSASSPLSAGTEDASPASMVKPSIRLRSARIPASPGPCTS